MEGEVQEEELNWLKVRLLAFSFYQNQFAFGRLRRKNSFTRIAVCEATPHRCRMVWSHAPTADRYRRDHCATMRLGFLFVGSTSAARLLDGTFDLGLSKCLGNMMLTQIGRGGTKNWECTWSKRLRGRSHQKMWLSLLLLCRWDGGAPKVIECDLFLHFLHGHNGNQARLGAWGECQGIGGARWKCLVCPCLQALEFWNTRLCDYAVSSSVEVLIGSSWRMRFMAYHPVEHFHVRVWQLSKLLVRGPDSLSLNRALDIKSILAPQSQQRLHRVRPACMGMHTWATSCGTTGSWDWLTSTWRRWVPLALCPGFVKSVAITHAACKYSKWT